MPSKYGFDKKDELFKRELKNVEAENDRLEKERKAKEQFVESLDHVIRDILIDYETAKHGNPAWVTTSFDFWQSGSTYEGEKLSTDITVQVEGKRDEYILLVKSKRVHGSYGPTNAQWSSFEKELNQLAEVIQRHTNIETKARTEWV